MSISQINTQSMQLRAVAALRQNAAVNTSSSVAPSVRQADSVELSDGARALSAAKQSVAGANDVREDRVAALKASIAAGTYKVDSRALARSMIRNGIAS